MLGIVTFKWKAEGYIQEFTAEHVNTLSRMVKRHYGDHRFFCVTDDPAGLADGIEYVPLWDDFSQMCSPHGPAYPSCYRRLKMFSTEAGAIFGERFVTLDLDCVIVGDMRPVWDRPEDIVLWGDTNPTTFYNGSMLLMSAGARRKVWDDFNPARSPGLAQQSGQFGSDQGWISYCLGPGEAKWNTGDGVLSYRLHVQKGGLAPTARIVHFHGKRTKPWSAPEPWVRENWR